MTSQMKPKLSKNKGHCILVGTIDRRLQFVFNTIQDIGFIRNADSELLGQVPVAALQ